MNGENREIGLKSNGKIQEIIDGGNQLDTRTYLSAIISGTVKDEVKKQNAKKVEISERSNKNQSRPDFSDLLDM